MKEVLTLNFSEKMAMCLDSTLFEVADAAGQVRRTEAWRDAQAHPQEASFRWSKGLMTLCLLLLRLHLGGPTRRPLLVGMPGSAAATFDNLVHKADSMTWLRGMLNLGEEELARARLMCWFERQNSQANNRERPIRIFAGSGIGALPPENIRVTVGGKKVGVATVARLEKELAAALSEAAWQEEATLKKWGTLPGDGALLVGRDGELARLGSAVAAGKRILQVVAPGGCGKTSLARRWVEEVLQEAGVPWRRVFLWSYYRQGFTSEAVQPLWAFRSALAELLEVSLSDNASAQEMVEGLLEGFFREPTLLVLDGAEAVLHATGERAGFLNDDVLPGLLRGIVDAGAGATGLCLLTSRVAVADILAPECGEKVERLDLQPLTRESTRRLLRELAVEGLPGDLEDAVKFTQGHPLLIRLLASRYKTEVDKSGGGLRALLAELRRVSRWSDRWSAEDPAMTRMLRSYADGFAGTPELALLQLAAMFDRLPDGAALRALLADLDKLGGDFLIWHHTTNERWEKAARQLRECGLVFSGEGIVLEMHPIVHGFFAGLLKEQDLPAYRAAHVLLYEHFTAVPEKELPDTLEEMQPLMQAIHHGCQAGQYQRTFREIAWTRLSRGIAAYILVELGAYQEVLVMMSCFCTSGWHFPPDSDLNYESRGGILQAVAHCERVQERLDAAIHLMRRSYHLASKANESLFSAAACIHIVRMATIRGRMRLAFLYCVKLKILTMRHPECFAVAPKTEMEVFFSCFASSIIAHSLLVSGKTKEGEQVMQSALSVMKNHQPERILLQSLGAQYHALWLIETQQNGVLLQAIEQGDADFSTHKYEFNNIAALVKGQAWTQQALDAGQPPGAAQVEKTLRVLGEAVHQARNFGRWLLLADALLARAHWYCHFGEGEEFDRDLNQCREIAEKYGFCLTLADLAVLETDYRLRMRQWPLAAAALQNATRSVKKHGYKLRVPTLLRLGVKLRNQY